MTDNKYAIKIHDLTKLAEYRRELRVHPQLRFLFFELTDKNIVICVWEIQHIHGIMIITNLTIV